MQVYIFPVDLAQPPLSHCCNIAFSLFPLTGLFKDQVCSQLQENNQSIASKLSLEHCILLLPVSDLYYAL